MAMLLAPHAQEGALALAARASAQSPTVIIVEVGALVVAFAIWRLVALAIRRGYKARAYRRIVAAHDALSARYLTASRHLAITCRLTANLLPHLCFGIACVCGCTT